MLLTLYEFEAKAQLGNSDLSLCLDTAEALPHADAGSFETLAGEQRVLYIVVLRFFVLLRTNEKAVVTQ